MKGSFGHHADHRTKRWPEENHDDHECADDNPGRIAASVTGLRAADPVPDGGCALRDSVHRAIDGFDVYDLPEGVVRDPDQRANYGRGVKLVDVILVEQSLVDRLQRFGE